MLSSMSRDLIINQNIRIPDSELRFQFTRSSGPGGQNVNKVNTKAVLHWAVSESPTLPSHVRDRLMQHCRNRINDKGELVLSGDRFRTQASNREDCLERLRSLILAAATPPRIRKKTRKPRRANEQRLKQKKANSDKKNQRRKGQSFED